MFRYLTCLLLVCLCADLNAQTKRVDSLLQLVYHSTTEQQRLKAIILVCDEYASLKRDTLDYYSFKARELAKNENDKTLRDLAELAVAYDYIRWGWTDSAIATVEPLILTNDIKDARSRGLYFKASRIKAMSYAMHSLYKEGLTGLYRLVSEAEKYNDSVVLIENINSIASIAIARNQPYEALNWLSRGFVHTGDQPRFKSLNAALYVNKASAYHLLGKIDSAKYFIEKGIGLFRETEKLQSLALALQKESAILITGKELDQAEAVLKEMLAIRQQLGEESLYQDDNIALVEFYIQSNQPQKGIDLCKKLLISGDLHTVNDGGEKLYSNSINIRLGYYEALARCYKMIRNDSLYQQTLENIIAAKDSFYNYNSAEAIAELQTKYEAQKKDNTIMQQKLDITRKNNRFYALLGAGAFTGILLLVLFSEYRKRQRLQVKMMLENEKTLSAQSVARAEENERKRIAADLHDNLGAYAASILSNLDIIMPETAHRAEGIAVSELRNNSQAMVAQLNDTIWALKKDALPLTAICDRIKVFIQRISTSYPGKEINVEEMIEEDITLPPSQAFHLFRIAQEAINNALRHSGADEILVKVKSNANTWRFTISDNGGGMTAGTRVGNGLLNMKERARESGWAIAWQPNSRSGTTVTVSSTTN